ncbi:MAG: serine hydrolase [Cryobacterium sp.]|nr:serine hydrolase [Cryobacterium sp.]
MTESNVAVTSMPEAAKARGRDVCARGYEAMPATLDTWQDAPHNRWTFAHVEEFVPSVPIRRGVSRELVGADQLAAFRRGVEDLDARLAATWSDAVVVVREGKIVGEWYAEGFKPSDRHLLMSVSKSVCGILIGALIDDGLIDVGRAVGDYIPELLGSAFGDATVQQVMDMTVAVEYDEEYTDLRSHVRAHDRIAGWRERLEGDAADTYEFLRSLRSAGPLGEVFQYCSANTDVLAWLIEAVTGRRFHEVLSERVWSRLGSEDDAIVTVDSSGFAFANGGISCTARDLARIGTLMLDEGVAAGGRVVSAEWVRETMAGGDPDAARGSAFQAIHPGGSYKNHWWSTGNERGNVYAVGIHGQYVWLDAPTSTAVVKFSSAPEPLGRTMNLDHARLFTELCQVLD